MGAWIETRSDMGEIPVNDVVPVWVRGYMTINEVIQNMIYLKISGNQAFFSAPGRIMDKSYPVITPMAARAVLESFYFKPAFRWVIDEIRVLKPIKYNMFYAEDIKTGLNILNDVSYIICAHIELTHNRSEREDKTPNLNTLVKHTEIFNRRVERRKPYSVPYLGRTEFHIEYELLQPSFLSLAENLSYRETMSLLQYPVQVDYQNYEVKYENCLMQDGRIILSNYNS